MSKDNSPSWDDVGKILLIVLVILLFWWWRSDNGRLNYIHELEDKVERYEVRIEELEKEVKWLKEGLY